MRPVRMAVGRRATGCGEGMPLRPVRRHAQEPLTTEGTALPVLDPVKSDLATVGWSRARRRPVLDRDGRPPAAVPDRVRDRLRQQQLAVSMGSLRDTYDGTKVRPGSVTVRLPTLGGALRSWELSRFVLLARSVEARQQKWASSANGTGRGTRSARGISGSTREVARPAPSGVPTTGRGGVNRSWLGPTRRDDRHDAIHRLRSPTRI
jgi:hypothetical protein